MNYRRLLVSDGTQKIRSLIALDFGPLWKKPEEKFLCLSHLFFEDREITLSKFALPGKNQEESLNLVKKSKNLAEFSLLVLDFGIFEVSHKAHNLSETFQNVPETRETF